MATENEGRPGNWWNFWVNGLVRRVQRGKPPLNWVKGTDGAWYPPKITTVPPPSIHVEQGPIQIPPPSIHVNRPIDPPVNPPIDFDPPPPTTEIPATVTLNLQVHYNVMQPLAAVESAVRINIDVHPPVPTFASAKLSTPTRLQIVPITLPFQSAALDVLRGLLTGKVESYFDASKELHSLLNFGSDYQALITDWMYDPTDVSGNTMLVKLYRPIPDDIDEGNELWVVRELAPPVIDRLFTKLTPPEPPKVYLRPANRNLRLTGATGASIENQTITSLFSTGSADLIRASDPVIEEWFTDDINSAELNLNYADYREFVFYGSAVGRLGAFINKLTILEDHERVIAFHSASVAGTGSMHVTGSATYPAIQALSDKRIDLLRSFDGYERFLYYGSGSAYSSSLNTDDYQDEIYYNADATWPKINGTPVPVASASAWIATQTTIASEYDRQNVNSLVSNIPAYLQRDENSKDFITFLKMIGHHFDKIKVYIDHMPNIHDRGSDPMEGLSPDLVWNVAKGFGIELPNQYSVKNLVDYTLGESSGKVYRQVAAETWKRHLHNQIFLMKTKGTKTSLRALSNVYGILPTLLQIRESSTPGTSDNSGSVEVYEEQTNALRIASGSFVEIPWAASSSLSSSTVEVRFSTTNPSPATLLQGGSAWALRLVPLSGSYGQVVLANSASTIAVASTTLPIFSGDFYSVMLRHQPEGMELFVKRAFQDDVVASSTTQEPSPIVSSMWHTPQKITLGVSGSVFAGAFEGLVDEVRLWGERLNENIFTLHTKYPGMYNGNTTTSARDSLYVRLSFNKPVDLGASSVTYIPNEAPSFKAQTVKCVNFPNYAAFPYNMENMVREVARYSPNAGASQFTTNKITISEPPVLKTINGVPVLSYDKSIVSLKDKEANSKNTNVVGFYFSMTDAINDSIIRSLGNIDLQNLIGDPADQYENTYSDLDALAKLYWESYAYQVNPNTFVDFVRNLLDPLFRQARTLIPARAKLLSGIVHEQNILERNKIRLTKPIEVDDTMNLVAVPVTSRPDNVDAGYEVRDVVFTPDENAVPVVDYIPLNAHVETEDIKSVAALLDNHSAHIVTTDISQIMSEMESLDSKITNDLQPGLNFASLVLDDYTNVINFKKSLLEKYGVSSPELLTSGDNGIDFRFEPGDDLSLLGATFTGPISRSYWDETGALKMTAANEPRNGVYVPSKAGWRRVLQLEGPSVNILTYSTPTVAQLNAAGTDVTNDTGKDGHGGFSKWIRVGTNVATQQFISHAASLTTGSVYCVSAVVEMEDGTAPVLGASTTTGDFCLVLGSAIAASTTGMLRLGNSNRYLVYATATNAVSGSSGNGIWRYQTQSGRAFSATGFQLEQSTFPTSRIISSGVSTTRVSEGLSFPWAHNPKAASYYTRFVDLGSAQSTLSRVFWIGTPGGALGYTSVGASNASGYTFYNRPVASGSTAASPLMGLTFGDRVSLIGISKENGAADIQSIYGTGSMYDATDGTAIGFDTTYPVGTNLYMNAIGTTGTQAGYIGIEAFAVIRGQQSLDAAPGIMALPYNTLQEYNTAVTNLRKAQTISINDDFLEPARRAMAGSPDKMLMQTVLPYTDFDKIESYTYFSIPSGSVAVPRLTYVRVNNNILKDRGGWTKGATYARNDVVIVSGSIGKTLEYVCVTTDNPFIAVLPPETDQKNWKPVKYVPTLVPDYKKAIVISGSVSLAPTTSTRPAATEYRPEHFKFTRDMRRGIIRHQWLGCVQSQDTTTDGKSPVEIFYSNAAELVVNNPGQPIQPDTDNTGPILDVR